MEKLTQCTEKANAWRYKASECKTLWGEPERVHRISAVNIKDKCTV